MVYSKLKKVLKKIIPKRILINKEPFFRKIIAVFFKGNNYQCPVCERKLRAFIPLPTGDELCPSCGSLNRHRRLWMILNPLLIPRTKVLDFSPPRCLYTKLKNISNIEYIASDFSGEFVADKRLDITRLETPAASFDIIICYHILEHIENDFQALDELFRVIKPGGCCFVQTPFREGDIYEDYSITNPTDRKEHFGQEDHVRIYSVQSLIKRLTSVGFIVEQANYLEPKNNYYGFHEQETILIATK